jgi:hypothetical protein
LLELTRRRLTGRLKGCRKNDQALLENQFDNECLLENRDLESVLRRVVVGRRGAGRRSVGRRPRDAELRRLSDDAHGRRGGLARRYGQRADQRRAQKQRCCRRKRSAFQRFDLRPENLFGPAADGAHCACAIREQTTSPLLGADEKHVASPGVAVKAIQKL